MTLPADALAPALVVLAALPESKAAKAGVDARNALSAILDPLVAQAGATMNSATQDAFGFLQIVMKNNPDKPLAQILKRPDVQQALSLPFQEADATIKSLASHAFDLAAAAGKAQAGAELDALGVPHGVGGETDTHVLQLAVRDITRNTRRATPMLVGAMNRYNAKGLKPLDGLQMALEDLQRRAEYSVAAAGKGAWQRAKEDTYGTAGPGIGKRWVTHFNPGTCHTCAGLHGTVHPLGQPFDVPEKYHWSGLVYAPPVHPNCRCELVPWPLDK